MLAHRGLDPLDPVNSNRSIIGTNSVSASFLKPDINKGELRIAKDVDIRDGV
jgi:hypothetical protein